MDRWKLAQHVTLQNWLSPSHKIWLWETIITLCQPAQLSFRKNSWNSTRATSCLQLQISDNLKQGRVSTIIICLMVQSDHLLIQLNQVCAYEKVLIYLFSPLVNWIFIILCQVEIRILGLKYPWNSTRQDQPLKLFSLSS